jgi:hypothetical protein
MSVYWSGRRPQLIARFDSESDSTADPAAWLADESSEDECATRRPMSQIFKSPRLRQPISVRYSHRFSAERSVIRRSIRKRRSHAANLVQSIRLAADRRKHLMMENLKLREENSMLQSCMFNVEKRLFEIYDAFKKTCSQVDGLTLTPTSNDSSDALAVFREKSNQPS